MADTPDISKIISVIMENPQLIEEISALVKSDKTESETNTVPSDEIADAPAVEASQDVTASRSSGNTRRELLSAMKPYLSEQRRSAIDSMISISGILDMMKKH